MKKNSSTKDLNLTSNERLFLESRSPFDPLKYPDFKPKGFKIYTFNAGYKRFSDDLVIICFDKAVAISSVYTQSSTPSAAVIWDKKISKKNLCKVLIVNSGNANAYTGKEGSGITLSQVNFFKWPNPWQSGQAP